MLFNDLITWGCELAADDNVPTGWSDHTGALRAATISWADQLGLGAPGEHCSSSTVSYSYRYPETPRVRGEDSTVSLKNR